MARFRAIDIDFDIHKLVQNERRGFDEPDYIPLRRLLGLPDLPKIDREKISQASQRPWSSDGISLPHGTPVRMHYNNRLHEGSINDGEWDVEGTKYASPSGAARGAARTRKGTQTRLDGWMYWEAKLPGETEWESINSLRLKVPIPTLDEL